MSLLCGITPQKKFLRRGKVNGLAQDIQFLGLKWQDGGCQISMDEINEITAMSPPTSKNGNTNLLRHCGFLETVLTGPHCIKNYHEIKSNMPYSLMDHVIL